MLRKKFKRYGVRIRFKNIYFCYRIKLEKPTKQGVVVTSLTQNVLFQIVTDGRAKDGGYCNCMY